MFITLTVHTTIPDERETRNYRTMDVQRRIDVLSITSRADVWELSRRTNERTEVERASGAGTALCAPVLPDYNNKYYIMDFFIFIRE